VYGKNHVFWCRKAQQLFPRQKLSFPPFSFPVDRLGHGTNQVKPCHRKGPSLRWECPSLDGQLRATQGLSR
jgi:hypothetical protein